MMKTIFIRRSFLFGLAPVMILSLEAQTPPPAPDATARISAISGGEGVFGNADPREDLPRTVQGNPDDPAYRIYRIAYNFILEERWDEARKKFNELVKKFPDSEYRDDAEYWTAYSYRQTNRKQAVRAYKDFLKSYRDSKYFDDALADLDGLLSRGLLVTVPGADIKVPGSGVAAPAVPGYVYGFADDSARGSYVKAIPSPAIAPMLKIRRLERMIRGHQIRGGTWVRAGEDLDEGTRLKLETIHALVRTGEDRESFTTLKGIALDPGEQQVLRVSAIEALSEFDGQDVMPVFVEIARNDTSEEMQLFAIDYIGDAARDKDRAFDVLMDLYAAVPAAEAEKRRMIFYSIAEIGNDRAIDFLTKVAKSHEDYELRREARYYLGTIGGEKARAALIELLKEK